MRIRHGWHHILAGWGVVLILALAGFAAIELAPSIDRAEATPVTLRGARIPQHDPFKLGPPAFEDYDSVAAQVDD